MKILIDVDALEEAKVLTPKLAATLRTHAIRSTGSAAINILLAFGAIAVAAGITSLIPSAVAVAFMSAGFILLGCLIRKRFEQWRKLGNIWMVIGALTLCGSVGYLIGNPLTSSLIAAAILFYVAYLAESRLLIALTPLALISAIGGSTGYWHACYAISVEEPTITIILFSVLAYASWIFAKKSKGIIQSLTIVFARMCVILVNMGFWIGSLWGDNPGQLWGDESSRYDINTGDYIAAAIPETAFIAAWAVVLILAGIWGAKNGRRFMVNTVATFAAIHFYTQWFENIGLSPVSVIIAGVATIAIGLGLWRYNHKVLVD